MNDTPTEREVESTWTRLRRRKVVQWAVGYVAASWGLLQGLEYFIRTFGWPEQLQQLTTLALLIGLPIVLVLAWYHGDRGEQRVTTPEIAILTVLLLLGGGVFWYFQGTIEPATDAAPPSSNAAAPVTYPSIAVLPFVNMSADKAQEYFADGISEELLNLLAQVPQLRVIARTSSFSFKGKDVKLAQVAEELNVTHVLEGSVRTASNKVRITAQLIEARSDRSLWSDTWDRELDDIFAVQDEIAAAVVDQLKITLLGDVPKAQEVKPEAYALFLQARHVARLGTSEGYEHAIALYQQALAIDPGYAAAWDELARNYLNQVGYALRSREEGLRLAREAVAKAFVIDPDHAPAYGILGWIAINYDGDLAAAAQHYEHALALEPTNTDLIGNAGTVALLLGRLDMAIALHEYANARDPVDAVGHFNLGLAYLAAGRLDEVIASNRTVLRLSPGYSGAHHQIGVALLEKGDAPAALAEMQEEPQDAWRLLGLAMAYHTLGRRAESDVALAETIQKYSSDAAYNIAYVMAWRGESDRAFDWLHKAVAQQDSGLSEIGSNELFANLHTDPRWLPFLRKIGKAPEQLAAIKFDVTVPN